MKRLEYQSTKLVPCVNMEEYLRILSEIYNYRTRQGNQIDFVTAARKEKGGRIRAASTWQSRS